MGDKKKLIGTYENPTEGDVDRVMVDVEMAKRKQELEAKGYRLICASKFDQSDEDFHAQLLKAARTGEVQFD